MTPTDRAALLSRLRTEPKDSSAAILVQQLYDDMPSRTWIVENVTGRERNYSNRTAREPVVHQLVES